MVEYTGWMTVQDNGPDAEPQLIFYVNAGDVMVVLEPRTDEERAAFLKMARQIVTVQGGPVIPGIGASLSFGDVTTLKVAVVDIKRQTKTVAAGYDPE